MNTTELSAHVEFGSDGKPTPGSLLTVARELETLQQAPGGSVQLAYYKTTTAETAALSAWIDLSAGVWENTLGGKYLVFGRNCGNYVREGMAATGRWSLPAGLSLSVPNLDFLLFRLFSDAALLASKATVTTEITGFRLADGNRR